MKLWILNSAYFIAFKLYIAETNFDLLAIRMSTLVVKIHFQFVKPVSTAVFSFVNVSSKYCICYVKSKFYWLPNL